eukprot:5402690-Heterocapsa_arctica.AAC.1
MANNSTSESAEFPRRVNHRFAIADKKAAISTHECASTSFPSQAEYRGKGKGSSFQVVIGNGEVDSEVFSSNGPRSPYHAHNAASYDDSSYIP